MFFLLNMHGMWTSSCLVLLTTSFRLCVELLLQYVAIKQIFTKCNSLAALVPTHSPSFSHKHFCSLFLRAIHIFRFQSELVWGGGQRTNKRNDENSWIPFWIWRYVLFAIRSHSIVIPWYAFVICASRSASEEDQQWTCTNDTIHVRNASTILFPKWSLEFSVITTYHSNALSYVTLYDVHLTYNIKYIFVSAFGKQREQAERERAEQKF